MLDLAEEEDDTLEGGYAAADLPPALVSAGPRKGRARRARPRAAFTIIWWSPAGRAVGHTADSPISLGRLGGLSGATRNTRW